MARPSRHGRGDRRQLGEQRIQGLGIERKIGDAPLHAEWKPDLLGGVMVIEGNWSDGSKLVAIPNYARMNRVGPPHPYPSDEEVDTAFTRRHEEAPSIQSKVWA